MKKIVALILAALLMFTLVGCTPATEPETPAETPETPAETPETPETPAEPTLVGVSMPTKSLQRWNQDGANMKKELEAKGYTVNLEYANDEVATQVSQIENMITKGCKILVIAAIDGSSLTNVLATAASQGIKTIAYDRLIMDTENVDYYATFDNFKVGVLQGTTIEDKLGLKTAAGPFNIEVFAGSPDDHNAVVFNEGAMSVLKPYIDSGKLVVKSGQTDFATIAIQGWKSEGAQARMDNLLTANYTSAKLDAVLSPNDSLAIGIIASLDNAGYKVPFPVITGQDCDKANVKAMKAGKLAMSVFKDTRTLAAKVVEMVDAIGSGAEVPVNNTTDYNNNVKVVPSFLCDPVAVTVDNIQEQLIDSGYYTEADIA